MSRLARIAPLLAIAFASVLIALGLVVSAATERAFGNTRVADAVVTARILASTLTAALAFEDRPAAQEYLNSLALDPSMEAVAVYDRGGTLFAAFARESAQVPATAPLATPLRGRQVAVTEIVTQGRDELGSIYVRTVRESWTDIFSRHAGVALLIVMASVMLVLLSRAEFNLRQVNVELAEQSGVLAAANENLRHQMDKRAEVEEALRQSQKMETIGQLTGGVAHDFNNILQIIMGNLALVTRRVDTGDDPERIKTAVGHAMQGAKRAATLTQRLLAFSRRQPLQPTVIDANRQVSEMSALLRRTLGEKVAIETVLAGGLWMVSADANQLENAILNLALNSRDAMPEGGKLTIETANTYLDARYAEESEISPGQYVVIAVSDTGHGMTPQVAAKAFEPFFTTKDVGHGTGLGLSQVYGFIRQSGGHVKIYSEVGHGTTVKIYLPRHHGAEEPPPPPQRALAAATAQSELVLIVEDEDAVRDHTVTALAELGYRVLQAPHGAAALEVLEANRDIVLLFTDVGLPGGMNGAQLAAEARARNPKLKVLFTTGYARNAIVHDGRLDPGVQLITKPFEFSELAAAIRTALQ